jgi:glycosyltransferase involved in cell wall biosynthesis
VRVAVVHGYYLHDSGSGIYVRELVRNLVRQGHDVTLVCQERDPELYDFIDSAYVLDENNREVLPFGVVREPLYEGRCRLVRPHLSRLLVYVNGPFPGFEAGQIGAFQDSPTDWIETYVSENTSALRTIFAAWPPDVVLTSHALMAPYLVRETLTSTPYTVTVHGSEINFSVRHDERLTPFTLAGLEGAAAVVSVSESAVAEVIAWAAEHGLDIAEKTYAIPPGLDAEVFAPAPDRRTAIQALNREGCLPGGLQLGVDDRIIACAGRVMWTKGVQYAVSCLPFVMAQYPSVHLLFAGDGPAREPLEELARLLGEGDEAAVRAFVEGAEELYAPPEFGRLIPTGMPCAGHLSVHFLGHIDSGRLGLLFAAADVSLAPSVFPESFGLVTIEALSAGALPLAAYHSGLASVVDVVAEALADPSLKALAPGCCLTSELGRLVLHAFDHYPTTDAAFRRRLHDICCSHFSSWGRVVKRYLELATAE